MIIYFNEILLLGSHYNLTQMFMIIYFYEILLLGSHYNLTQMFQVMNAELKKVDKKQELNKSKQA